MGQSLLNQRSLVRVHKANSHLLNIKVERLTQQRKAIAERRKATLERMENKMEVINYLIK